MGPPTVQKSEGFTPNDGTQEEDGKGLNLKSASKTKANMSSRRDSHKRGSHSEKRNSHDHHRHHHSSSKDHGHHHGHHSHRKSQDADKLLDAIDDLENLDKGKKRASLADPETDRRSSQPPNVHMADPKTKKLEDFAIKEGRQSRAIDCPFCERGKFQKKRTLAAYLCFFPFGFYCCIRKKVCVKEKCNYCGATRKPLSKADAKAQTTTTMGGRRESNSRRPSRPSEGGGNHTVYDHRHRTGGRRSSERVREKRRTFVIEPHHNHDHGYERDRRRSSDDYDKHHHQRWIFLWPFGNKEKEPPPTPPTPPPPPPPPGPTPEEINKMIAERETAAVQAAVEAEREQLRLEMERERDRFLDAGGCPFCERGMFRKKRTCMAYLALIICCPCTCWCFCKKSRCTIDVCNFCGSTRDKMNIQIR